VRLEVGLAEEVTYAKASGVMPEQRHGDHERHEAEPMILDARRRQPGLDWVEGDVGDAASSLRALDGCRAAIYLVHGIGEGADYHQREVTAATTFSRAAAEAGVERIV